MPIMENIATDKSANLSVAAKTNVVTSALPVNVAQLQSGILKVFNASPSKIATIYSSGFLAEHGLLGNATLVGLAGTVSTQLNSAKGLMNKLGIKDITKASSIAVPNSIRVTPGQLQPNGVTFAPNSNVPVNSAVIIASTLNLNNATLTIQPSVQLLTIIVETLICSPGATIAFDDTSVWNPKALPQTTAQAGNSYNPANQVSGQNNGPSGGNGSAGQSGAAQNTAAPAAPSIQIYALNIQAMPAIAIQGVQGAPGNPGQIGGAGGSGAKGVNGSDIAAWGVGVCTQSPGNGGNGGSGGNGGNGSNGGQGGAGGSFTIATTETNWDTLLSENITLHIDNAGGPGGIPGFPGGGGSGGAGGNGGNSSPGGACNNGHNGNNGGPGTQGATGQAGAQGQAGEGGTITPTIITTAEWQQELTLPWLETITPTQGYAGTSIAGNGLNFGAGDSVQVNGQSATAAFPAQGQFQMTLPNSVGAGPATITVERAADGNVSDGMTFTVLPFITSAISTTGSGVYSPGDTITLTGSAFLANASVHLTQPTQTAQVLVPTSVSANTIAFTVPALSGVSSVSQGTATIVVVNPDGLSSNTFQMTRLSTLSNGFLPSLNGFGFTNASACPGSPSLDTFANDFGSTEVAFSFLTNPVLTGAYYALYAVLLGPDCHGLCTGLAAGALNRFLTGITNLFSTTPAVTPALKTEFTETWGRQLSGQLLSSFLAECNNGTSQVLSTIQQVESAFSGHPTNADMPLVYLIPSGLPVNSEWVDNLQEAHTLVPYKLVRPAGWTGGYNGVQLYLYDCNNPGSDKCFITFTQSGSVVTFDYGSTDGLNYSPAYSNANGFTLGVMTMAQALYNGVDLPWMDGAGWVVDFILSPATLTVSNSSGQLSGASGSQLVNQVPGVVPSLLNSKHNLMLIPTQFGLQRTIQGTGSGTYSYASIAPANPATPASEFNALLPAGATAIVPGERSFTLQNVACTTATKDGVLLGPDNQSVLLTTSESNKTFDVVIAQRYDVQTGAGTTATITPQAQQVQLSGITLNAGEQLLLWADPAIGQVGISNPGVAKTFNVTISAFDSSTTTAKATKTVAGSVAANADFKLNIGDWTLGNAPTPQAGALHALLPAGFKMPALT